MEELHPPAPCEGTAGGSALLPHHPARASAAEISPQSRTVCSGLKHGNTRQRNSRQAGHSSSRPPTRPSGASWERTAAVPPPSAGLGLC